MCYYCNPNEGECNEENPGDLVKCQEDDKLGYHYGDACVIGHTSKNIDVLLIPNINLFTIN